jgi:tight adherence protein B
MNDLEGLRWVARALLAAACAATAVTLLARLDAVLRVFDGYLGSLDRDLKFLRAKLTGRIVLAMQGVLASLALLAAGWERQPVWLALPLLVAVAPRPLLHGQRAQRVALIDAQIDTWLQLLANSLHASSSLGEALETSARLIPAPLSEELDELLKAYHLGTPLDEALEQMGHRVGSRSLQNTLLTLRIARNTGGDLALTLENVAATLREMARLDGVIRTKTAEGKAQAVVIALIPLPLFVGIRWLQPDFFDPLLKQPLGNVLIGVAAALWLGAALLAQRILAVDV